ncbi:MAG TPA: hypothetical protein DCL38_01325 [Lachnospiraceae bacterium]|nr:hypothetical protein [Lachnospiraceae bacterium]
MSLVAPVIDGQVTGSSSAQSVAAEQQKKAAPSSTMDKESFLQLLVAQMKYQDPMEPTSNTEYISQYAQFSELEQMQNLSGSMNLQRASGLVGQYAVMEHVNESTGATSTVEGRVDYVTFENNKAFLSIDGTLYPMDELTNVMDSEYATAVESAEKFTEIMNRLPGVDFLSIADRNDVETLQYMFNNMSSYQQEYITDSQVSALQEYVTRMSQIVANAEAQAAKAQAEAEAAEKTGEESTSVSGTAESGEDTGEAETEESVSAVQEA